MQTCKASQSEKRARTRTHARARALVKVRMLRETKGQMVDGDAAPALAKVLEICFFFCLKFFPRVYLKCLKEM